MINLLHLKYSAEIAKAGSLNKAAKNLYMGQPNLSRAIKELESSIGITIFSRSPRGMLPTREGEEFLRYANSILAQVDEIEAIYRKGAPVKKKFSISVPRASYISEAFVRFSKSVDSQQPSELVYKETNSERAIINILDADYKLGIIRYAKNYDEQFRDALDSKGLHHELITEFHYVLCMSRQHPLASLPEIRFTDLEPFTEIAHADPYVPSIPLSVVRKEERPQTIANHIYVYERSIQFELLSENKDTFMWVSAVPENVLERYGLVQRVCPENQRVYRDVLIYRKDYTLSELDTMFINELNHSIHKNLD